MVKEQYISHNVVKVTDKMDKIEDRLAIEEPLELRLAGETVAITMRTPGDDHLLAKGFFFCEGFIKKATEVGKVFHCGRLGTPEYGNVIDVMPAPGVLLNFDGANLMKRGTLISSACGVCGRTQIDDLVARCEPFENFTEMQNAGVANCLQALSKNQPLFDLTGGVHAAAVFTQNGDLVACFEDVGRHNATDKIIGKLFESDLIGTALILVVSGRLSFEIVQKATMARIAVVIGISAPTSLAVELAQALKLTLIGFARGDRWTLYTGEI
jgi:FdhD protein